MRGGSPASAAFQLWLPGALRIVKVSAADMLHACCSVAVVSVPSHRGKRFCNCAVFFGSVRRNLSPCEWNLYRLMMLNCGHLVNFYYHTMCVLAICLYSLLCAVLCTHLSCLDFDFVRCVKVSCLINKMHE